jgi:L-ribulose-5-phosphate 4-epimerase
MREKEVLIKYARKIKELGLVSIGCNKGSISMRIDQDKFIIGPSRLDYDELKPEDINTMYIDGTKFECNRPVSMDTYFHSSIFINRQDVNCIIHTHSRYATALALAGKELPLIQWGMKLQFGGSAKICDFYRPDDERMNIEIINKLGNVNAVLLKNHGCICVGKTIESTLENILYLEELSESYVHALLLGRVDGIEG